MPEIKKILIIRLSSFGDIVLSYPFIMHLRKAFPDSKIDFLVKKKFSGLLKMHSEVNNILEYKGERISELRQNIKNGNYDLILDIHKNIRSVLSTIFLHSKKIGYRKGTLKKLLFVAFKINLSDGVMPVYKRYLLALDKYRFLKDLDFSNTDLDFDKTPLVDKPYIIIAPSSRHFTKTLPKEKIEEIIKGIKDKKFVLIGEGSDIDTNICKYLSEKSEDVINYCGKTDFNSLANLIYNSELVLCNDSGVLHLAEALNKKVMVFFGSTVKEFGFYPQLESTIVFENNNLKCRPCTHIGKNHCPKKHFKCMNEINTEEVIKKVNENIS